MVNDIAWLIFIRAGSSRFPQKCFAPILGKNVFQWISERSAHHLIPPEHIFLCTSVHEENKSLIRQAQYLKHQYLTGPEEYPLQRITTNLKALQSYKYLVRICGDSPFYPFGLAQRLISTLNHSNCCAITNTRTRCFPSGYSIEIYNRQMLYDFFAQHPDMDLQEHMSAILHHHYYKSRNVIDLSTTSSLDFFLSPRYTLDYRRDIEFLERAALAGHDMINDLHLKNIELS